MMRNPFIPAVLAGLLLIAVIGAYVSFYMLVDSERRQNATLTASIVTKNQDTARIASARAALGTLATAEASIQQYFVNPDDIVSFLESLQGTGKEVQAKVAVVSVAASAVGSPHLNLSLEITGSFDSIMRTLGRIEYGPYDTKLQSLTLDTAPVSGGTGFAWTASAVFTVGTRLPAAAIPKP